MQENFSFEKWHKKYKTNKIVDLKKYFSIEEFNYLTDKRPSKCTCKFRYRQSDIDINVKYLDNNNLLLSYKGSKAVTPGQFCVLYDKDICLGGGIIKEVK